ncbi:recombinase family protein [Moraxella nasovis]|uniref:recombinase family protein n=1 Tax=Moraxella nasovis TaxID=2904121 RepID=UPI001F6022A1|nr:recombinase family protein [Moraxella nasovis]UNU73373.1 recombinase family protein [Moraxella nasovis]
MADKNNINKIDKLGKHQIVGYIRVSSLDQNTERQLDGVTLDRVFIDKITGSTKNRPQLNAMLDYVRFGDTVIVHSLDRLARNLEDLLDIIKQLNDKGVIFQSLKENVKFDGSSPSAMDKLILHIFGAIAEFNRSLIREAQKEGIAKAKQRGAYKGRKPALNKTQVKELKDIIESKNNSIENYKELTLPKIADQFGVSLPTINRYIKKIKEKKTKG